MKLGPNPKELTEYLGSLVPAAVLTWALAVLTASYVGIATKIDAAFISSLVTSVLAVYGISKKRYRQERNYNEESSPHGG